MSTIPPMQAVPTFTEMPMTGDPAKIFDNFDRRIHKLEQLLSGSFDSRVSWIEDGNLPDEIIVDGVPISMVPPEDVTGVTATPDTFFENIFCDVEWDEALTGPDAVSFDVDLAEKTAGPTYTILNVFSTAATNIRINNLEPNKDYGVRVVPVNNIGVRAAPPAWVDFTTGADSTIPPAPSGIVIGSGATTVVVKFDGLTEVQAPDVAWGHGNYEIEIDTVNTFDSPFFRSTVSSATVVAFNDITPVLDPNPPFLPDPSVQLPWYARVRAIDSSGNASAWSAVAGPSGPLGGVDGSMLLSNLNAAYIQFGTMSGDRITVNTLDAGRIKTSSITAADITLAGGSFRAGSPPTTGVLINSQGVRLYQGGSAVVILDAVTGNATFSGAITASTIGGSSITGGTITGGAITGGTITGTTITGGVLQTSATGQRVVITGSTHLVEFFSGDVDESHSGKIAADVATPEGESTPYAYLEISSPRALNGDKSTISLWGAYGGTIPSQVVINTDSMFIVDTDSTTSALYVKSGELELGRDNGTLQAVITGPGTVFWTDAFSVLTDGGVTRMQIPAASHPVIYTDLEIQGNDIGTFASGLFMYSADGTRWLLRIDNTGAWTSTPF